MLNSNRKHHSVTCHDASHDNDEKKKKKLTDHRRKVTELILQLGNKLNHSFEYADHRHNCITKNHDHRSF